MEQSCGSSSGGMMDMSDGFEALLGKWIADWQPDDLCCLADRFTDVTLHSKASQSMAELAAIHP